MKIFIVCSTNFYSKVDFIKGELEQNGHIVVTPNCYDNPVTNEDNKKMNEVEYLKFFRNMFFESRDKIRDIDAILVLNYTKEKNGESYPNYIGASTFLEMYEAFMQNKKIYMINECPDNMLSDEILGFGPIVLNGDLSKIK